MPRNNADGNMYSYFVTSSVEDTGGLTGDLNSDELETIDLTTDCADGEATLDFSNGKPCVKLVHP